ncbi:hypothetical protein K1719_044498 [Acacia pycnantha]|nr:hypothetical protein K1719_044498 [Acacia pycnantha]
MPLNGAITPMPVSSTVALPRAASVWHVILPSGSTARFRSDLRRPPMIHQELKEEGSWNAAWDAHPSKVLHRPDSTWLFFGVYACLAPPIWLETNPKSPLSDIGSLFGF